MSAQLPNRQRTALITGSGKNIGRAIAIELAQHVDNVIINGSADRAACDAVAHEVESAGATARVCMADVGVKEQAVGIAEQGIKAFGSVDVPVSYTHLTLPTICSV